MLSRLARRVPSHCASDIAASGTSSGGQTPWFTTRMSSPPSARAASSTARLAPPGSPRSAWTATVSFRPLPPPTALIVSSASAFLLRYPTATLAPARASSSAVARPMPRPPPVTKARLPERSITALEPQLPLHQLADQMFDGEVYLLNVGRLIRWDHERVVHEGTHRAATLPQQRHHRGAPCLRPLRRPDDVGALAARRVQHQEVVRAHQGLHLPREHLVEAEVV